MNRYWVSWYTGNYADEGCTTPPFQTWITGSRERPNFGLNDEQFLLLQKINNAEERQDFLESNSKDDCTMCAMIDADSVEEIWEGVEKYFPDFRERFIELQKCNSATPGDRFPNFENRTRLYTD